MTSSATPLHRRPGIDLALGFERLRQVIYTASEASMTSRYRLEWSGFTINGRRAADRGRPQVPSPGKSRIWELRPARRLRSGLTVRRRGRPTPAHRGRATRPRTPAPKASCSSFRRPSAAKRPPLWTSLAWPTRSDVAPMSSNRDDEADARPARRWPRLRQRRPRPDAALADKIRQIRIAVFNGSRADHRPVTSPRSQATNETPARRPADHGAARLLIPAPWPTDAP